MKNSYVTDTMALVLRLEHRRMGNQAKSIYELVETGKAKLFIPAMVLAEIGYLSERKKIDSTLSEVRKYCNDYKNISIQPITEEIIFRSFEITDIPELHDRIIAGTAYSLGTKIITNDPMIIASEFVSTLW